MTVHLLATGGTISSHHDGTDWTNLDGAALLADLGADVAADVVVTDIAAGPSSNLTTDGMVAIGRRVQDALAAGAEGVVVTHGTDTMELTAFATQLLLGTLADRRPVVFTGSMRVHSHAVPDGPSNMRDALAVARSTAAVGREVLVCLNRELHAADRVQKRSAWSVDAFDSFPFASAGVIGGLGPLFAEAAAPRRPATAFADDVPLVTAYPGIPADDLARALDGARGAVVDVFGDLNAPHQLWGPIHRAASNGVLVVLASRPFTPTAANEGLELLGAVGAGGLTAQKARLALMAALGSTTEQADAVAFLHQYALEFDAHDRSTTT